MMASSLAGSSGRASRRDWRRAAQPGDHRLLRGLAGERQLPGEELEGQHAEGVDVAAAVERLAADLLRAHELRRAQHDAGRGELGDLRRRRGAPWRARSPSPPRGCLPASSSGTSMTFSGLRSRWMIWSSWACCRPRHIWTSSGMPSSTGNGPRRDLVLAQRLALQVGHHEVDQPVRRLAQAQDGADVRMVEPHGDRRLPPEPLDRGRIAREPRYQDLHRHRAARLQLLAPGRRMPCRPRRAGALPGSARRAAGR